MRRVFLLPNVITAFGLTCGLFVIFKTSIADPSRDLFSLLQSSAILLLIAALADVADGAVARLIKAESEFGLYFDSLSDAVNFGVAPPLLILKSLSGSGTLNPVIVFFVIIASMIYTLCGVLRLVRYNLQKHKEIKKDDKGHFIGFPIPAAASCALSAGLITISPWMNAFAPLSLQTRALLLTALLMILGYFMISRWKFPSVKALHFRVPSLYLIFATGIFAVVVLYGILDYFAEIYFIVSWLYLIISWALSIIRVIMGKKAKTLEDFGSDEEE